MISPMVKELGFDGYVCGCGSQIYMNNELLFSSSNPNPLCREVIETLRQCRISAFFERPDKILYDGSSKTLPKAIQNLKAEVSVEDLSLYEEETWNTFTFDKFLAFPDKDSDTETFRRFVDEHFSCFIHDDAAWRSHRKTTAKLPESSFWQTALELLRKILSHSETAPMISRCSSMPESALQWDSQIL